MKLISTRTLIAHRDTSSIVIPFKVRHLFGHKAYIGLIETNGDSLLFFSPDNGAIMRAVVIAKHGQINIPAYYISEAGLLDENKIAIYSDNEDFYIRRTS